LLTAGSVTSTPLPTEQLPNEVSVTQRLGETVPRSPPIFLEVSDLLIEQDPSTHNGTSTWSWHSRRTGSWAKESTHHVEHGMSMAPITVSQPGLKAPMQANTPQPYPHDSGHEKSSKSTCRSLHLAQKEHTDVGIQ
jgi:hypothetical protein